MFTKEKLESESFIRFYKAIGNYSMKYLMGVEETLSKRKKNIDFNFQLKNGAFATRDNTMHYISSVKLNDNGTYLKSNITKTKGSNLLDISLELGTEGFDFTTGERFDRKQAKVEYTFQDNNVEIKKIKDEVFYNELEEKNYQQINERVKELKK